MSEMGLTVVRFENEEIVRDAHLHLRQVQVSGTSPKYDGVTFESAFRL